MLGEGNGGGALAFLPADRVVAAQHAWLSPLPPEGASAIVHRDLDHAPEMARRQQVRAIDLHRLGVVDRIVAERPDAADEPEAFCQRVGAVLEHELVGPAAHRRRLARRPGAPLRLSGPAAADGATVPAGLELVLVCRHDQDLRRVSGAASGIGAATTALLREQGHRVITVDRADLDGEHVTADLGTPAGRAAAVAGVQALTDVVHGVVPAAGLGGLHRHRPRAGHVGELLRRGRAGARPAARSWWRPAARRWCSSPPTRSPACPAGPSRSPRGACATTRRPRARSPPRVEAVMVYPATKAALAWWARREGVKPEWIGAGIRLNSVAPGKIATAMTAQIGADPVFGPLGDVYPTAIGRDGRARGDRRADRVPALRRRVAHGRHVPLRRRRHRRDPAPDLAPRAGPSGRSRSERR